MLEEKIEKSKNKTEKIETRKLCKLVRILNQIFIILLRHKEGNTIFIQITLYSSALPVDLVFIVWSSLVEILWFTGNYAFSIWVWLFRINTAEEMCSDISGQTAVFPLQTISSPMLLLLNYWEHCLKVCRFFRQSNFPLSRTTAARQNMIRC